MMAYSNWGAFVYKDGNRRKDREDVGVFDTDEAKYCSSFRIFANIIKRQKENCDEWYNHSHHAVLGDGVVRLCGYKSNPSLWVIKDDKPEVEKLPEPNWDDDEYELQDQSGEVTINGKVWKWGFNQYQGNMIDLTLTEPDGSKWKSSCGYCYGTGHMD